VIRNMGLYWATWITSSLLAQGMMFGLRWSEHLGFIQYMVNSIGSWFTVGFIMARYLGVP